MPIPIVFETLEEADQRHEEELARMNLMYSRPLTTYQALWMGIIIVAVVALFLLIIAF